MQKGRVTISTDENYVEGTKKIAALWGRTRYATATARICPRTP